MTRSEMVQALVEIYSTRPAGCSDYHICDMLLSRASRLGMSPPPTPLSVNGFGWPKHAWELEDEE